MNKLQQFRIQLALSRLNSRGFMYDSVANPFPRIWVGNGGRLSHRFMNAFSITHIINCANEEACPENIREHISKEKYTCLGAIDSTNVDLFDTWYPNFKHAMDTYLRDPSCKGVYVHCQAGINRSAFLAAGYLIRTCGISFDKCIRRMLSQRPCIMTNQAFQAQLIDFVKT